MTGADALATLGFASAEEFEHWLERSHEAVPGVWLKLAKKGSGVPSVDYDEAVHVALCFGWIDGQVRALDERFYVQRFTPRRARSSWSQTNRARVAALEAAGRIRPAGRAQIDAAKADGRWDDAYPGMRDATVPDDLQAALDANPAAGAVFATLSRANRYAILYRVHDAKRAQTRAQRIERFVAMLEAGETIHP